ncbi:ABC transporter ATP-binding protein [Paenibacillus marinisediminis]
MSASVIVSEVSKQYGKKEVLVNANLTIQHGEIFGMIGPSGAGKTTLVRTIVGMDNPTKGKVTVLGTDVPNLSVLQNVGYMAQSDALYPELTGKENLDFFASLFQLSRQEQKQRIAYVANLVQLTSDLSKKVEAYSGGMKRRLSLAIALVHDPQVLVLDEPTVGMDPELRFSIWNELDRLKQEGKTIIVTTHVMDEADRCDCLAMVREGKIITTGSPAELKLQYGINSLEEVFIKAGSERI